MDANNALYEVQILRKDGNNHSVFSSENWDECYKRWEEFQNQWEICGKEKKPFIIKDPFVTAFDPGLVYEVRIMPLTQGEQNSQNHNPYHQQMTAQGFGAVMQPHPATSGRDLMPQASGNQIP